MEQMAIRIPWDKHEVVLLFDAYERIQKGEKRNAVAAELSEMLRSKAIRAGLQIDDVFRNINGMLLFLGRAEYIYTDGKKGLPNPSKIIHSNGC